MSSLTPIEELYLLSATGAYVEWWLQLIAINAKGTQQRHVIPKSDWCSHIDHAHIRLAIFLTTRML